LFSATFALAAKSAYGGVSPVTVVWFELTLALKRMLHFVEVR